MPLAEIYYPQSSSSNLAFIHSPWRVREEEDQYGDDLPTLLALADRINDSLTKAEALSWLLHQAGDDPQHARSVTAQVIAELIHEALEAHETQWKKIRRYYQQK